MVPCPPPDELQRWLVGPPAREPSELGEHVEACPRCQEQLSELSGIRALLPERASRWPRRDRRTLELASGLPALLPADEPDFIGKLGGYLVRGVIGRGGMGVVLAAFDPVLRRPVAIKVLSPSLDPSSDAARRFLREAQSVAALSHENIVPIYAVDQVDGVPFLVLKFVDGESLSERLERQDRMPIAALAPLAVDVARALAAAHEAGLVHRDIKPGNILIEDLTGRAKLTDFGLAKPVIDVSLTSSGLLVGTPEYMSPEQVAGRTADERSDLFSLGAVLYAAASGVQPFHDPTLAGTFDRIRTYDPRPLHEIDREIPRWFSDVVERLMAKTPDARPPSAANVAAILARTAALPPPRRGAIARPGSRWPRPWLAATAGLAALVALAAGLVWFGATNPTRRPPDDFLVSGTRQRFASLDQAIHAAPDGATIEVTGDGPYLQTPLRIAAKRLTIRAAPGALPVLAADFTGPLKSGPLIATDSDLRLEGLEIRWTTSDPPRRIAEDLAARGAVVASSGRLSLAHCRIRVGPNDACIATASPRVEVADCQLFCPQGGNGIRWRPPPAGQCAVRNCAIETQASFVVGVATRVESAAPAVLSLKQCTLSGALFLKLLDGQGPKQVLQVEAEDNVFDVRQVVALYPLLARELPATAEEAETAIRRVLRWSERRNLYARESVYAQVNNRPKRAETFRLAITAPSAWAAFWSLDDTGSDSGEIVLARPNGESGPPRLVGGRERSGAQSATLGSSVEIGPGRGPRGSARAAVK